MGPTLLRPVLVLDAGYQAVNVVPMRRALRLIATGKAVAIDEDADTILRSERECLNCPRIIRLFIAVAHRVYRTLQVRFNKRNVMARDNHRCQYCGSDERLTIDHVVPRSRRTREHPRGGPTTWENCVTACLPCNLKKGNRTPDEAGMALLSKPSKPRWFLPLVNKTTRQDGWVDTWGRYLGM